MHTVAPIKSINSNFMKRTAIRKAFVGAVNFSCKRWGGWKFWAAKSCQNLVSWFSLYGRNKYNIAKQKFLAKFGAGKVPVPTVIVLYNSHNFLTHFRLLTLTSLTILIRSYLHKAKEGIGLG